MSALLAQFPGATPLRDAAMTARNAGYRPIDAFSPFPIEGLAEIVGMPPASLRIAMFGGGVGVALLAYGLEWWTAVADYPINSGGRPLHSWPTFVLFPFAIGILAAAIAGLIAFLLQTGLPRLHHPLFGIDGFERVTQDRFVLALAQPETERERKHVREWLREAGAVQIWEVTS